jgi:hypothetical protein
MQRLSRHIRTACRLDKPVGLLRMTGAVLMVFALAGAPPAQAQSLPADAQATCTISTLVPHGSDAQVFASWFHSGAVTANGLVDPPNSVTFINQPNCPFYQWAERMFMWLTSPAPGGGRILDSEVFFDVSPVDEKGTRIFISHGAGRTLEFSLRSAKVGPHGLPVILDTTGRMLEVQEPQLAPNGKQLILDSSGKAVEIERATLENGVPSFLDHAGKPIQGAKPLPSTKLKNQLAAEELATANIVQKLMIEETPVFMTLSGKIVDVEQGQAQDNGVLEAQNGSLVYYATMVNDVYAYFLTREKALNKNDPFPTTKPELDKIKDFASAHGTTFSDPNTLTVEVKSSWVRAAGLPHRGTYITMNATIPTYDKSNPKKWKPNGKETVELALVGIHVVGSVAGHPEMIWATFEHFNNVPIAEYKYNSTSGVKTVPQATSGPWLFSSNSPSSLNVMHMQASGLDIVPVSPHAISPSDTIRWKPWGAAADLAPNPISGGSGASNAERVVASNTEILSINNNVRGMMADGDIRRNYILSGATWTIPGTLPLPCFTPPAPGNSSTQVGTSQLANSTMETYQQGKDNTTKLGGSNCFSCHVRAIQGGGCDVNPNGLSHVYGVLLPLAFPPPPPTCQQSCQATDQKCVAGCGTSRDTCMNTKPIDPKLCVAELNACKGECGNELMTCTARCK